MGRRETIPPPIVRLRGEHIAPVSQFDAEELARYPNGTQFDMIARTKRSHPQLRLYWAILGKAVKVTGRWPTSEKLHEGLKMDLGRTEGVYGLRGKLVSVKPDSIALDKMPPLEFTAYFDEAMALLAEVLGYDPLQEK
jgi:hypothetical protein